MAIRKNDVVKNLTAAADRLVATGWSKSTSGKDVTKALCPGYTPTQIKSVGIFADFITAEYGERSLIAWNDQQSDRRKIVRALNRAARQITAGTLPVN